MSLPVRLVEHLSYGRPRQKGKILLVEAKRHCAQYKVRMPSAWRAFHSESVGTERPGAADSSTVAAEWGALI